MSCERAFSALRVLKFSLDFPNDLEMKNADQTLNRFRGFSKMGFEHFVVRIKTEDRKNFIQVFLVHL